MGRFRLMFYFILSPSFSLDRSIHHRHRRRPAIGGSFPPLLIQFPQPTYLDRLVGLRGGRGAYFSPMGIFNGWSFLHWNTCIAFWDFGV